MRTWMSKLHRANCVDLDMYRLHIMFLNTGTSQSTTTARRKLSEASLASNVTCHMHAKHVKTVRNRCICAIVTHRSEKKTAFHILVENWNSIFVNRRRHCIKWEPPSNWVTRKRDGHMLCKLNIITENSPFWWVRIYPWTRCILRMANVKIHQQPTV